MQDWFLNSIVDFVSWADVEKANPARQSRVAIHDVIDHVLNRSIDRSISTLAGSLIIPNWLRVRVRDAQNFDL